MVEQVGRLGLTDEPGIYYVFNLNFQAPRDVCQRKIDREIALAEFQAAHSGLMPWQYSEYGAMMDWPLDRALLEAFETADRAFVAADRAYRAI